MSVLGYFGPMDVALNMTLAELESLEISVENQLKEKKRQVDALVDVLTHIRETRRFKVTAQIEEENRKKDIIAEGEES